MQTKLTLRLDDSLVKLAKEQASKRGKSVSKMVADYFASFESSTKKTDFKNSLTPVTKSLIGIAKGADLDEQSYKDYLTDKYK